MNSRIALFPLPHIVFDDNSINKSNVVEIENKQYTIEEAISKIEEVKDNISDTKEIIDLSIESLKSGNTAETIKHLEDAENKINCPKCKNKLIINQAKINIIELACSTDINDESVCNEEKGKMISELEELSNIYMKKVEDFKIDALRKIKETSSKR